MQFLPVTNPEDPRLADYVRLRDSSLRRNLETKQGLFIAEGEKVIRRALDARYQPRSFMLAERWLSSLSAVIPPGSPVYVVSEALAESVTGFHVHRGALGSFYRESRHRLEDLIGCRRLVLIEDIVDHTNVGAIIRNAAGLGWDGVLLAPNAADPLYRRSIKVAMGTVFSLPWVRVADHGRIIPQLQAAGFTVAAMALTDDAIPIKEFKPPEKLVIVLGTEGAGLSARWLAQADRRLLIPMRPEVDSLNVAAASAVACYVLS